MHANKQPAICNALVIRDYYYLEYSYKHMREQQKSQMLNPLFCLSNE